MSKKTILFIINPISGGRDKNKFEKFARRYLDSSIFSPHFVFTKKTNHAELLAQEGLINKFDYIIAVGGDGTINEVAKVLMGTDTPLGIIPKGSGNGLARALHIPLDQRAAIAILNKLTIKEIDAGYINGLPFFNMAGMGFDALISSRFVKKDLRGPVGYMQTVLNEISNYKPLDYEIVIDGRVYERKAFMISIANSPQYGNEAYISPKASMEDGLLDVCIVKPFNILYLPKMIYYLFNKTADKSKYVEIILGKNIKIKRSSMGEVHVDGEPVILDTDIEINVAPNSLKVIC
jgi:YegS/Rv2252/BmrU family lipid kinase